MRKMVLRLVSFLAPMLVATTAFAQDAGANEFDAKAYGLLAAGVGLGLAAFGGALGQGRAAAAALTGIARNPNASGKLFTPMILGLALIESLVLYSFAIAFVILIRDRLAAAATGTLLIMSSFAPRRALVGVGSRSGRTTRHDEERPSVLVPRW